MPLPARFPAPAVVAALLGIVAALMPTAARADEAPAFEVIDDLGAGVEVRDYAPMLLASIVVDSADFGQASSLGFPPLADYISGDNNRRERIGMTSPVTQGGGPGRWVVGFVMPARYTAESLPRPRDPRIRITSVPRRSVAAIRFRGRFNTFRYAESLRVLEIQLGRSDWIADGEPQAAQYDAPWVPGPLRRNEVLLPVRRRE
ncbi:MAG TPA: SOUL heme-binding protein [Xanthomonadaceae bacterium]|jgi:hypothetical protein|nr:SOUL heme-binding protein [Xanthomonadaceae bacterium]